MKTLKELLEARAAKEERFEVLAKKSDTPGQKLTETELKEFDDIEVELVDLDKEIKKLQDREARKLTIAARKAAGGMGAPQDDASEAKEIKKYSFAKAFSDVHNKKQGRLGQTQGFENEMHQEAQKEADECGFSLQGNICVPSRFFKVGRDGKRILTVGTEGTDVVQTEYKPLIPYLHPEPLVDRLGITVYSGLKGNLKIPRSTNDLVLGWETETSAADETTPTFDAIDLTPHRLAGYVDITLQMLAQSPFVMESFIRRKLEYAYANAIDKAVLYGPGTGNAPLGILNYPGVNVVSLGSSGGDITYGALIAMLTAPMADNARTGNSGWVFNTNGMAALALTPMQVGGTEGNYILKPETGMIWGHKFIVSNQIPSDLVETATGLSAMIFSPRWESAILATWGGVDILFDPYTQALTGTVRFVVNTFADVDVEHPEEFAVIKDWNTTLPALT